MRLLPLFFSRAVNDPFFEHQLISVFCSLVIIVLAYIFHLSIAEFLNNTKL
jgi:hypothetical protein